MRATWLGLALLAIGQSWLWAAPARAQTSEAAPAANATDKPRSESSQGVKRVEPEILFVKDAKGVTIPLLNITLEDIEKALDKGSGAVGAVRPSFRLDRMVVSGETSGKYASLTFQFQITIFSNDKKWVRVPLRLAGAALEKVEHQGEGEQFLVFDETDGEYVSWFRSESEKPHTLTLRALVPLEQSVGQTRLKLNAPRAVHSELTLKTSAAQAVGEVSGAVLAETRRQDGNTEFKAIGLTSEFSLAWRDPSRRARESRAALDAQGEILVQIDRQSVISTAELTVRAFGREFESFRVRLPPGAALVPSELSAEHPDYSVAPADASDADPSGVPASWVEVRRKSKSAEPLKIRLKSQRALEETTLDKPFELAGFEIEGAARQWGDLAVFVANDWQVAFGKRVGMRQVEDLTNESFQNLLKDAQSDEPLAAFEYYFEYFRQPCALPAQISPQETVIGVDPHYLVQVSADKLQLDAKLAYKVSGAKAFALEIDLPGWDVDATSISVRSGAQSPGAAETLRADLTGTTQIVAKPGEPISIPLKPAVLGRVEVTLKAQRKIAEGAPSIEFELPRPVAASQGSAELTVLADQNVELTPRDSEIAGLQRQQRGAEGSAPPPGLSRPNRSPGQGETFIYRGEAQGAKFAADFRIRPRQMSVEIFAAAALKESGAVHVDQTFSYRIQYEPAETLMLEIPQVLYDEGQFKAFQYEQEQPVGGELSWESVADEDAAPEKAPEARPLRRVRVKLHKPALGLAMLKIEYDLKGEPLMRETSVPLKLPLVMPAEGECSENQLDLTVEPGVKAEPLGAEWASRAEVASTAPQEATLRLEAARPWPELTLSASLAELSDGESAVVERAWIQTRLSKRERSDRAVYRFESRNRLFSLLLPQGSIKASFWLDGEPVVDWQRGASPDERVISLHDGASDRQLHMLEVRYSFPDRPKCRSLLSFELPKLGSGITARRTYWQLILPGDEYLVAGPSELTSEAAWSWRSFYWARRPLFDQKHLEAWVRDDGKRRDGEEGLAANVAFSPSTNQYLFSSIEIGGAQHVRTASRSSLVLIGSGLVLLAGLTLIYAPALRHPALLFVAAIAVFSGALIYPEVTLLWLQAAVAGALLTGVAGLLERNVSRRRRREVLIRGASSSIVNRNSTRTHPRHSVASAPASTATAAVAVELSASEPRP